MVSRNIIIKGHPAEAVILAGLAVEEILPTANRQNSVTGGCPNLDQPSVWVPLLKRPYKARNAQQMKNLSYKVFHLYILQAPWVPQ
jgi:hypothetical protein